MLSLSIKRQLEYEKVFVTLLSITCMWLKFRSQKTFSFVFTLDSSSIVQLIELGFGFVAFELRLKNFNFGGLELGLVKVAEVPTITTVVTKRCDTIFTVIKSSNQARNVSYKIDLLARIESYEACDNENNKKKLAV